MAARNWRYESSLLEQDGQKVVSVISFAQECSDMIKCKAGQSGTPILTNSTG